MDSRKKFIQVVKISGFQIYMNLLTTLRNRMGFAGGVRRSGLPLWEAFAGPPSPVNHGRVRRHARELLGFLSEGIAYPGEVFLCGGAYKAMLRGNREVNDLDLWVRNRKERERLSADLLARGGRLLRDFHPYCLLFEVGGQKVEITYQNVNARPIAEIVGGFDIAGCAIAATYRNGLITDSYFSELAADAARRATACLERGYLDRLRRERLPTVLRSIDRLGCFAEDVGYRVMESDLRALWDIFRDDFTLAERRKCVAVYLQTTAGYKGSHNERLVEEASAHC